MGNKGCSQYVSVMWRVVRKHPLGCVLRLEPGCTLPAGQVRHQRAPAAGPSPDRLHCFQWVLVFWEEGDTDCHTGSSAVRLASTAGPSHLASKAHSAEHLAGPGPWCWGYLGFSAENSPESYQNQGSLLSSWASALQLGVLVLDGFGAPGVDTVLSTRSCGPILSPVPHVGPQ